MRIDLDRIAGRNVAIHIPTREHGIVFIEAMRAKFPEKVVRFERCYLERNNFASGQRCFYPRLHQAGMHMTHGDRSTYADLCVDVLEFDSILIPDVEMETGISDLPIESLFS